MQNGLKPSGAKATGWLSGKFRTAHIRLTILYVVIFTVLLAISSGITYSIFSSRLTNRFRRAPIQGETIVLPNGVIIPNPHDVQIDLMFALVWVNGMLLLAGGLFSYWFAGVTLEPIEEAYERQRVFLSNASHELRTPLTILQIDFENTLANQNTTENIREKIKSNLEEVTRMGNLVNDLLLLSRLDEERATSKHTVLSDISAVLSESTKRLQPIATQAHVSLLIEHLPEKKILVAASQDQLLLVVANLIKNAIAYNREHGSVTIDLRTDNKIATLVVHDTGIGIAPENLEKIFDRFYRVEQSRSRKSGGSGLGLAIVKSIVHDLAGSIAVTSQPGEGTTVTVNLPIHSTS